MDYTKVVLVDENDTQIGVEEKYAAHTKPGKLHRAFSVLLFNDRGELLIQKRANSKKTFSGLISNSVCSHPAPKESYEAAAYRRTFQELGIFPANLAYLYTHIYSFDDPDSEYTEHELAAVFIGNYYGEVTDFDTEEVEFAQWINLQDLKNHTEGSPENFTPWFRKILNDYNYFEGIDAV